MSVVIKRVMPGYIPPVKENIPAAETIKEPVKDPVPVKKTRTKKGAKKNV